MGGNQTGARAEAVVVSRFAHTPSRESDVVSRLEMFLLVDKHNFRLCVRRVRHGAGSSTGLSARVTSNSLRGFLALSTGEAVCLHCLTLFCSLVALLWPLSCALCVLL